MWDLILLSSTIHSFHLKHHKWLSGGKSVCEIVQSMLILRNKLQGGHIELRVCGELMCVGMSLHEELMKCLTVRLTRPCDKRGRVEKIKC